MPSRRAIVRLSLLLALFTPATLLAKPDQRPAETPVASQASATAKAKSASKPAKKPAKKPVKAQQVPELDGASAGLALLLLGGMVLLMRETRQPA